MDKNEVLDIYIIVNMPRLTHDYDEPIEAILRRTDGTIVHNIFSETVAGAEYKAEQWILENGHLVGAFSQDLMAKVYRAAWVAGQNESRKYNG